MDIYLPDLADFVIGKHPRDRRVRFGTSAHTRTSRSILLPSICVQSLIGPAARCSSCSSYHNPFRFGNCEQYYWRQGSMSDIA